MVRIALTVAMAVAPFPARADAQSTGSSLAEISGRVIDSETRAPLQGATIVLRLASGDAGRADRAGGSRVTTTTEDGGYRFTGLPPATYRLEVSRIGYIGATLEVDLRTAAASRLSVGLETSPIELEPIAVLGGRPEPYGRLRTPVGSATGPIQLIDRVRQERFLVSDTRELTHTEVMAAVTLAETDLFRALQRVPGVGTRDDYTATMWTRGATWDQTRVYFDGLPLFNPTHAGWLFAAVNPDAVASATFHPGFRPARWGEGSAGVLDLRSRSGQATDPVRGTGEVSMASVRLALDGQVQRASWMVAARRSYVDVFDGMVRGFVDGDELNIPYDFTDVVGRFDLALGRGWEIEASSMFEYDHLRGDIPGLLEGNRGRWGNRLGRIGVGGPIGPVRANLTVGGTDFSTLIFPRDDRSAGGTTLPTLENGIRHRLLSVEVEGPGAAGSAVPDWTIGAQAMSDSVSYDGPFSLIAALAVGDNRNPDVQTPFRYGNALDHTALWGEKRWSLGPFSAVTGVRLEMGDSVANGGVRRWAPRIAVRARASPGLAITGGWTRAYQYTQDVSPAAGPIGPQLHLSAIWVLASSARAFPAVRTDLGTAGIESAWGDGWSFIGNVYERRSSGLKVPNPAPGYVTVGRDPDVEARNRARGLEVTLRRDAGRWTGSLGYALGSSLMTSVPRTPDTPTFEFPSSADIRHGFDATGLATLGRGVRLGAAFTFGSGVPFTEILIDGSGAGNPPRLGEPNARRTPAYASLDLMAEYERRYADWSISGYLQVRNVLDRDNAVTYAGTWDCPSFAPRAGSQTREICSGSAGVTDRFEPGLPRLPLVGFRIAF